MLEHDLDESIGVWITLAAEAYRRAITAELAPHGVTFRQCQVLGYLAYEGPLAQNELAERMRIEPPTLVGILDRMERDGWIRREACADDRRKKLIFPTRGAQPVWQKMLACGRRVRQQASAGLTAEQLATLRAVLTTVRSNLEGAAAVAPSDLREPAAQGS